MSPLTITAHSSLCLVIGDPISHSLSPAIHNAGYAALKLPFVMAAAHVTPEKLRDALRGMRAMNIRGLAVTMPHKISIVKLLDALDSTAQEIGAVNTVVNEGGKLVGYNTDWIGIVKPLERLAPLRSKKVLVLGAGGAAQAAVFGCTGRGAQVTICNRTINKARTIARTWKAAVLPIEKSSDLAAFDVIINTTSLGMGALTDESPIPASAICKHHTVFETIYDPFSTRIIRDAEAQGATVLRGVDMFLEQGLAQFELHTGGNNPGVNGTREVMEKILRNAVGP